MDDARRWTRQCTNQAFVSAVADVDPRARTAQALRELTGFELRGPVTLLAAGKAAWQMAAGVIDALGAAAVSGGLVVTKDGHAGAGARAAPLPPSVEVRETAHPWPDERSLAAADAMLARAAAAPASGTIVLAVSGGASSLVCAPVHSVGLADKLAAMRAVAAAGASIQELNVVRKHLSRVKGGWLLEAARARVLALVLSDVVGDDVGTVGGGLAAADPSRFADALAIAARVGAALPTSVRQRFEAGARGGAAAPPETPKRADGCVVRVIAGPDDLARAAAAALAARGVEVAHVETRVTDAVESLAARLAARAQALAWRLKDGPAPGPGPRPALAVVAGGEPVVRFAHGVTPGRGGRAQHTALAVAERLAAMAWPAGVDVSVLCGASDGTDGPTDDAGAIVDSGTWARAAAAGVDPARALAGYDSGTALAAAGDLLTTLPTGSNLCDLFLVCVARG